jgi:hypothetical protein
MSQPDFQLISWRVTTQVSSCVVTFLGKNSAKSVQIVMGVAFYAIPTQISTLKRRSATIALFQCMVKSVSFVKPLQLLLHTIVMSALNWSWIEMGVRKLLILAHSALQNISHTKFPFHQVGKAFPQPITKDEPDFRSASVRG